MQKKKRVGNFPILETDCYAIPRNLLHPGIQVPLPKRTKHCLIHCRRKLGNRSSSTSLFSGEKLLELPALDVKSTLRAALDFLGWDDHIEHDWEKGIDSIATTFYIDDQIYCLQLIANARDSRLALLLVSEITVPAKRFAQACAVINAINTTMSDGNIEMSSTGSIYYRCSIDAMDAIPSSTLWINMINCACNAFNRTCFSAVNDAAHTRHSAGQIVSKFRLDSLNIA
jgi:hypothetical protein